MKRIEVALASPRDPSDETRLYYRLYDRPISSKYWAVVKEMEEKQIPLFNRERFYNFPDCEKRSRAWIANELNRCIDMINGHRPGAITHRADEDMSQPVLNELHLYFERYRGPMQKPAALFLEADPATQQAIDDFNLLIHRFEEQAAIEKYGSARPRGVCTWEHLEKSRYPLADEDYYAFSYSNVFGGLKLDYCMHAKPILDAFFNEDEIAQVIKPLSYYSADMILDFGQTWLAPSGKHPPGLAAWWKKNYHRVAGATEDLDDPRLSLGSITVGELIRSEGPVKGLADDEIVALVGRHQFFKHVRAI